MFASPLSPDAISRGLLDLLSTGTVLDHDRPGAGDWALHVSVLGVGILDLEYTLPKPTHRTVKLYESDVLEFQFVSVRDAKGNERFTINNATDRAIWSDAALRLAESYAPMWDEVRRMWTEWCNEYESGRIEAARERHDEQRLEDVLHGGDRS